MILNSEAALVTPRLAHRVKECDRVGIAANLVWYQIRDGEGSELDGR
jgi:hypothetical protein